jgi:23S rRNA pseudouridine1911/1915/1917 synthase
VNSTAPPASPNVPAILVETEHFLVVDKPAQLIIHPTKPGTNSSLWHQLRHVLAFELVNGGQLSLINRLDRETSGLVLAAKDPLTARELHTAMQKEKIAKEYLAIVHGWPEADEFTVNAPIIRQGAVQSSRIYLKRAVHPTGAPAETSFRVSERFRRANKNFALVTAYPKTGRTHQIRVHLAHAGYPIVGDKIYGADETCYLRFIESGWTTALQSQLLLPRHALHASRLTFTFRGHPYSILAPPPADLAGFGRE